MNIKIANTKKELNDVYDIRKKVFVEEQQVPLSIELDEHEDDAIHFICYNTNEEAVGASRLRLLGTYGKLERICVLSAYRGQSIGKQIIQHMEEKITQENIAKATLNAQTHAIIFYEKLGYTVVSEAFIDAGIPHVTMEKQLNN